MAYNRSGGKSSSFSGKGKTSGKKGKSSSSRDRDSENNTDSYRKRKPFSEKEKKFRSKDNEGAFRKRSGDDDRKEKFKKDDSYGKDKYAREKNSGSHRSKKDDSYRKNDKYKGDGEKKHYRPFEKKHDEGSGKKRSYDSSFFDKNKKEHSDKPFKKRSNEFNEEKRFKRDEVEEGKGFKGHSKDKEEFREKKFRKNKFGKDNNAKQFKKSDDGTVRLNKYLAHAGISSRREADVLIKGGTVKVNGVVVTEMGYKVKPGDVVTYADATIKNERKVYLLLNKPKDFITTTDDPQERRTVMELVRPACKERIYPVGRLDRNTTGLLLFTNDGDLATKLMHPKHEIRKVYHVTLNRSLTAEDYKTITEGFDLQDGPVKVDDIAYVGEGKKEIGLEIHSGRNRIVRRLFEQLGYEVIKLDRVSYAGLTKKDLPRGKYRFLSEKEVAFLKMLS